jgi:hypothetical protein
MNFFLVECCGKDLTIYFRIIGWKWTFLFIFNTGYIIKIFLECINNKMNFVLVTNSITDCLVLVLHVNATNKQ